MKVSLLILAIIVYFVGMFITKIVITVHDNSVSTSETIDDFDIVFMLMWPIMLPLIVLYALFMKLFKIAEDIGDQLSIKLRYRRMGLKKPKEKRGKDNE